MLHPKQEGKPLVLIRVDEDLGRVVVVVSGSNYEDCHDAMSTFTALTLKTTNQPTDQKGWATERVRSLHHEKADVTLLEVMIDVSLPLEHRRLICPETRLPMRAEELLAKAGLLENVTHDANKQQPWWAPPPWQSPSPPVGLLRQVSVEEEVSDHDLFDKFALLFEAGHGEVSAVRSVSYIDNPQLRTAFETQKRILDDEQQRQKQRPLEESGWRGLNDFPVPRRVMHSLND